MISNRTDWETPREVFNWAERKWGPFYLDAAATKENALCIEYLDTKDDSLSCSWCEESGNGAVWVNPPYSRGIEPWIDKMIEEGKQCRVVALLPAKTDTQWFAKVWDTCDEIVFHTGRYRFTLNGEPHDVGTFGTLFAKWDPLIELRDKFVGPMVWRMDSSEMFK